MVVAMQHGSDVPEAHLAAVTSYRPIEDLFKDLIPAGWAEGEVVANGIRQHFYRTGGDKPPLVLLHGILAGGITWLRVAAALAADYDVEMPDARGHGRSQRLGADGISFPLLVADAAALIGALGLERPFVLGHSMGGVTAALLAAAHPERVRAIALEDAVWGDTSHMPQIGESQGYRAWLVMYTGYLEALKGQTHAERMRAALPFVPPGSAGLWPEEEYVPWVEAQSHLDLALVRAGPALWSSMRPEHPLAQMAGQIACPMLLMTGDRARGSNVNPDDVAAVLAVAPAARHVAFADAGHLIHLDQFERYLEVIAGFLAEHGGA